MDLVIALYIGLSVMTLGLMRTVVIWYRCERWARGLYLYDCAMHCKQMTRKCLVDQIRCIYHAKRFLNFAPSIALRMYWHDHMIKTAKINCRHGQDFKRLYCSFMGLYLSED